MIKWLISLPIDDFFYGININPIFPIFPKGVFCPIFAPVIRQVKSGCGRFLFIGIRYRS